jgi:hypothetical protein
VVEKAEKSYEDDVVDMQFGFAMQHRSYPMGFSNEVKRRSEARKETGADRGITDRNIKAKTFNSWMIQIQ